MNQQPNGNPGMNASGAPMIVVVPEREWKAGLLQAGNPFTKLCEYRINCSMDSIHIGLLGRLVFVHLFMLRSRTELQPLQVPGLWGYRRHHQSRRPRACGRLLHCARRRLSFLWAKCCSTGALASLTWPSALLRTFRGVPLSFQCMLRQEVRKLLRIRGTPVKDFCASVICMANVIAQSTIELQHEVTKLRVNGLSHRPPFDANSEAQGYPLTSMPPPAYQPPE